MNAIPTVTAAPIVAIDLGKDKRVACGLSPREFRSGSSVRGRPRLAKAGNARLRKALYLPTLTAIRFNPLLQSFFDRLVAAGKPKMQAVGACMRKLVMLCYGVLKHRRPFTPPTAHESPLDNTLPGSARLGRPGYRRRSLPRCMTGGADISGNRPGR